MYKEKTEYLLNEFVNMGIDEKIEAINYVKQRLHEVSPMKDNPVDCVLWIKNDNVHSNDYNPNSVAPPEMELLEVSIMNDGYTQPIVSWGHDDKYEIVDGFHRHRVGKESEVISKRIMGYLPLVNIRTEQSGKNDRIASTIRHNRARGKHKVDAMSDIVIELKKRNWKNNRIAKQLGMDEEEVLRLLQVSGLETMFKDDDFSNARIAEGESGEYEIISDELTQEEIDEVRVVNVDDPNRIFHTYDKRECHKAGLYATSVEGKTQKECENEFTEFFKKDGLFQGVLNKIIKEWKFSCEHYLTNNCMNRIAWIGQAAVCYETGIPKKFASGWFQLDKETQERNNIFALYAINKWLVENNMDEITMKTAMGGTDRQMNIY